MKRTASLLLLIILLSGFLFSCKQAENETSVTDGTTAVAPPQTSEWEYLSVDLSGCKYKPENPDAKAQAAAFGYTEGTYEYDYFRALSGLSFYTAIAENCVENAQSGNGNKLSRGFAKSVGEESFLSPYGQILYSSYLLLHKGNFSEFPLTINTLIEYWNALPYELDAEETRTELALYFTDVSAKLSECASELLSLGEKYPDYAGEFALPEDMKANAETLLSSCGAVTVRREEMKEKWRLYYFENTPTLDVTEEFIREKNAVKITLSGNARYYIEELSGVYIENFKYEMIENSKGIPSVQPLPMDSPVVIYLPVAYYLQRYYKGISDIALDVYKADEDYRVYLSSVKLSLNPLDEYSEAPVRVSDGFLDFALERCFGGEYSEKDLLRVSSLYYYCGNKDMSGKIKQPDIMLVCRGDDEKDSSFTYFYSEYKDIPIEQMPVMLPETLEDDLAYFKGGINNLGLTYSGGVYPGLAELAEKLSPFYVTENTWK